jgi:hypothetical protein
MRSMRPYLIAILCWAMAFMPALVQADIVLYRMPGTSRAIVLRGTAKVNPGKTVTFHHQRGTLHFSLSDCEIHKVQSTEGMFKKRLAVAEKEKTVDGYVNAASWALANGLLERCNECLSKAYKLDKANPTIVELAKLKSEMKKQPDTEENREKAVKEMRALVKRSNMEVLTSQHFILLHDTGSELDPYKKKTRAQIRIELLEKVYESFYMKFLLSGRRLELPKEFLRVVLFAEHDDYKAFCKTQDDEMLQMTAGFYNGENNTSFFYIQGTSDDHEDLKSAVDDLKKLSKELSRAKVAGRGDIKRMVGSLELLTGIMRENEDVEVVSHEATHHLAANSGLLPRKKAAMRWAHEGLASYFESPKEADWAGIGAVNENRLEYYKALASDPEHGTLEFLVTDKVFDFAASHSAHLAAYGQAWALTHFLMERHFDGLMEFYNRVAELDSEKILRSDIVKIFEETIGDLTSVENEWRSYMRGLKTDLEVILNE